MPVPPAQSVGLSTQPYATQSSTLMPPGQPAAFGTQSGILPARYMAFHIYSGLPPPSNAQMGFGQMGYPVTYGLPQPESTTYMQPQPQPQPPAYGSESNRDGTVGSYGSTAATQESVHPQI